MYLRKTIERNPRAVRALVSLGTLEIRAGNDVAAVPFLERAAALAPGDPAAQRAYGRALARYARRGNADSTEAWARARRALLRASELDPTDMSTLVTLAEVEMAADDDPERAAALMRRAVAASPGREEYRLMLAQAVGMAGDYEESKRQFRHLAERGSTGEIRDAASRALARVERAQRIFEERFGAAPFTSGPDRRSDIAPVEAPGGPGQSAQPRQVMRTVRASERRVFGTLISVQCRAGVLAIRIDTADDSFVLAARDAASVEVISYRSDGPSAIACQAAPAIPVFATFVEEPVRQGDFEADYRATAIEFLPEGFVPQ
jgi:tetratricopeptide (TPR) repeat protein